MVAKRTLGVAGALVACSLSACVAHFTRGPLTQDGYRYVPPSPSPEWQYTAGGPVELHPVEKSLPWHDAIPLSYTSSGVNGHKENLVEGLYLRSRLPGRKKLLVVLPIWGSSRYPPQKIAYGYAAHAKGEAHVIWLFGDSPVFPWQDLWSTPGEAEWVEIAEDSVRRYRTAVNDTRRLIDWLGTREEVDPERIGIVGFSMGALAAATIMGIDSRVAAGVFMTGGAILSEVMAQCRGKAGRMREHAIRTFGWSQDDYRRFFDERFGAGEPMLYAGHYDPDRILIIEARFDSCIPPVSREALWKVTGHPQRITLLYSHNSAYLSLTPLGLNFARRGIYRFLDRSL